MSNKSIKSNILPFVAIVFSAIAIAISIIAMVKVNNFLQHPTPESISDINNSNQQEDSAPKYQFDQSLIGDWQGAYANGRDYVRMRIMENSDIIIEAKDGKNFYLYYGYIENNMTVIKGRSLIGKDESYTDGEYLKTHEKGEAIETYINNPDAFEMEEYSIARPLSKATSDALLVNFGVVQSSAGEITVTLSRS